jgi:hypothetical protein
MIKPVVDSSDVSRLHRSEKWLKMAPVSSLDRRQVKPHGNNVELEKHSLEKVTDE